MTSLKSRDPAKYLKMRLIACQWIKEGFCKLAHFIDTVKYLCLGNSNILQGTNGALLKMNILYWITTKGTQFRTSGHGRMDSLRICHIRFR